MLTLLGRSPPAQGCAQGATRTVCRKHRPDLGQSVHDKHRGAANRPVEKVHRGKDRQIYASVRTVAFRDIPRMYPDMLVDPQCPGHRGGLPVSVRIATGNMGPVLFENGV